MLTGQPPFVAYKGARLMVAHFTEVAPSASHVRDEVPVGIAQVLEKGMAKEPADRYPTAAEFRDALSEWW
jgi:serine/threonine-protein kinase